jgi:probable blue pigment (indigoidine) exporter
MVLGKKWGRPEGISLLTFTGWQLAVGGLILAPATLVTEGLPGSLTTGNVLGYLWLGTVGAMLAYALWFRGIERLPATSVSLLGLTNPLVATLAGLLILGQTLTPGQLLGFTIALASLIAGQRAMAGRP